MKEHWEARSRLREGCVGEEDDGGRGRVHVSLCG